jgi:exodeoxyribonuclease VII large subunit
MLETGAVLANTSAMSVSELSGALKKTLEDRFGYVRVRGEISGYRGPHASGHVYFALKDEGARLDAVIWKSSFLRMRVKPADGLEVIASGKLTTFAGKSSYQIVIDSIEPAGVGALMALLESRRRQLAGEGLFDLARKRPLPFLPSVIGIVTSPNGSVIRDILHRLADRFPVHVIVWPVRVQGDSAAEEIAAAIGGLGELTADDPVLPRPDVVIVARGGGSLEDLWSFNEEIVVRAAFASPLPLISAVGHETDWTLIDHAADVRAPTPTAAGELCTPVRSQLLARVDVSSGRLTAATARLSQRKQVDLRSKLRALQPAVDLAGRLRQRLDSLSDALTSKLSSNLNADALVVANLARRHSLHTPQLQLIQSFGQVRRAEARILAVRNNRTYQFELANGEIYDRLARFIGRNAERRGIRWQTQAMRWSGCAWATRNRTTERAKEVADAYHRLRAQTDATVAKKRRPAQDASLLLSALNYESVLARGYAVVRDNFGLFVSHAERARNLRKFTVQFFDGNVLASPVGRRTARHSANKSDDTAQKCLL